MLNRTILIGRLTKDPELRYTPNGNATASFTLAVNRPFKDDEADFIPIVTWRQTAEACANYSRKGMLVAVEGRIQVRQWDSDNGRRYVTEVIADNVRFLERNGRRDESNPDQPTRSNYDPFVDDGKPIDIPDSDLPF